MICESLVGIDFSRFSPQARITLLQAKEEARKLGHGHVGTEHALLALSEGPEDDSVAGILAKLCVTPRGVRSVIEFALGRGTAGNAGIPFNPSMARVVDIAERQVGLSGRDKIGTLDLLHAIVEDGENTAVSCLESLGVLPSRLHAELVRPSPSPV